MNTTRGRAVAAAIFTSTLALGLTACGGDEPADTSSSADSTVEESASAESTDDASADASAEASDDATDDAAGGDADAVTADFMARMTAGLDLVTTAAFTMDIEASGQNLSSTGVLDYTTDPVSMSMTMTGIGAEAISVLSVDGQQYMQMPSVSGDKWISTDAAATDLAGSDPLASMREFEKGVTSVVLVGEEEAGGVPATHYVVTLDSTKMAATAATPGMPAELTYDIWLDSEGRMVKMTVAFDVEGVPSSTTMTLTGHGAPVSIVAPSPDMIMEMPTQG